jgi:hypothetical protein
MSPLPHKDQIVAALDEAVKSAGMRESAARTYGDDFAHRYEYKDGDVVEKVTGLPAAEYLAKHERTTRPHLWPDTADNDLEAKAFGQGNVSACGELHKKLGAQGFAERQAAWGVTRLGQRGKAPEGSPGSKRDTSNKNPWSAAGWNLTEQGRLIRASGVDRAAALAKSAGSFIGAVRPATTGL